MNQDIHIPPEAVEAGMKAVMQIFGNDLHAAAADRVATAAIRAALENWPGMHTHEWQRPWLGGMSGTDIILPLTEKTDD